MIKNVQNITTPATIRSHADATKSGPAAPVTRSASRSNDLKHWKTIRGKQDMRNGVMKYCIIASTLRPADLREFDLINYVSLLSH